MKKHSSRKGFTLAEVLLTLLGIGVVCAITVPPLVNYFQEQQYKSAYKKVFSVASQTQQYLFNNYMYDTSQTNTYNFDIFKSQFSVVKDCSDGDNTKCWDPSGELACSGVCNGRGDPGFPLVTTPCFIDKSGIAWCLCYSGSSYILVDTNGIKPPNKYGRDRWFLYLYLDKPNISPHSDNLVLSELSCHYPPCYSTSWLLGK